MSMSFMIFGVKAIFNRVAVEKEIKCNLSENSCKVLAGLAILLGFSVVEDFLIFLLKVENWEGEMGNMPFMFYLIMYDPSHLIGEIECLSMWHKFRNCK
jgi:hypothetical protein